MEDRRCTAWAVGITVVTAALGLLYSILVFPALNPGRTWYVPNDAPQVLNAGWALVHGHLHQVYSGDRELYALPLSFPYTGLIAMILSWHHLTQMNPPWWLVVTIPMFLAPGILVLQQTRRLAWELGMRRRLWGVQAVAAFLVLAPTVEWGHPEDVLALAGLLFAVRRVVDGDLGKACLWLSVAIAFKQWAVMLVPLFVLATPSGGRLRALGATVALPGALAGLFLAVDFHGASAAFLAPVTQVNGFPGHPGLVGDWLGAHSSQANRLAATALACVVGWRRRNHLDAPVEAVATVALVLLLRPLTETINYAYYWSPGLLLLGVVLMVRPPEPRLSDWLWPVAAIAWTLPRSNDLTALDWWAGEALLLAVTAWRVAQASGHPVPLRPAGARLRRPQAAEVAG